MKTGLRIAALGVALALFGVATSLFVFARTLVAPEPESERELVFEVAPGFVASVERGLRTGCASRT